nr:TonB-dependent outer membrane receptor [Leptospira interrogans serovar Copenhageni/Icterohaemorrhagiae]
MKTKSFQKVFLFQKMRILGSLVVFVNKSLFRNLRTYFRNLWCGNSYRNLATEKSFKFGDSALRDITCGNYCILLKIFPRFVDFFGVLKITPKWILKIISILFISNVIMAQEPNTEKEENKKERNCCYRKSGFYKFKLG